MIDTFMVMGVLDTPLISYLPAYLNAKMLPMQLITCPLLMFATFSFICTGSFNEQGSLGIKTTHITIR